MKWVKTPEQYWVLISLCLLIGMSSCTISIRLDDDPCDTPYREYSISCAKQNVRFYQEGWFTIIGDGNEISISTLGGEDMIDGIEVYEGDVCASLTLIGGITDNLYTFSSVDGQRYFVKLLSDGLTELGAVTICSANNQAINDGCSDAISWEPETLILGSTANATVSGAAPECLQNNERGVWYTMIGDGQTYNLNLLNANLVVNEAFTITLGSEEGHYNIYEGNCSNLVCVLGKDATGPTTFTFQTGETYYIYVTARVPDATYTFMMTKSTCTDLITDMKIETCPGGFPVVTLTTSQNNLTFLPTINQEQDGILYSTVIGTSEGVETYTTGVIGLIPDLEGYIIAFEGNDPFTATCWDYVYYSTTGNEPDITPPTTSCKNATLELDENGSATLENNMINNGSSDNCTIVSRVLSKTDFDCSDVGMQTVTFTVKDAAGLSASCTANVTVSDLLNPVVLCNNPTIVLDANGSKEITANEINNNSYDNCGIENLALSKTIIDCVDATSGTIDVELTATDDNGNTSSCTSSITVIDDTPPNAQCMSIQAYLDGNGEATIIPDEVDNNSTDACGIQSLSLDNTTFTCVDIGPNNSVILTVTDNNGNTSNCNATVTVIDGLPPTAVCKNTTVEIQPNGLYALTEVDVYDAINSSDNCAIDAVSFPATTFSCDDLDLTIPITLTLADASSNMSNCNALITVALGDALPNEWNTSDIGQVTIGNTYSFDPCANDTPENGEFTITGSGNNAISTTSDNIAFAYQSLCGNGSITAKIESISAGGYGGLMIRETTSSDSKQVAVFSNLTNILRHETRYLLNANKVVQAFFKPSPFWLKLERQGDWFFAYYSSTGSNFQYVHGVYVPMQQCIEIGMASFTYLPNAQTEAVFSHASLTGNTLLLSQNEEQAKMDKVHESMILPSTKQSKPPKLSNRSFNLHPNPNNGRFTLQFEQVFEQEVQLALYNEYGQEIKKKMIAPQTNTVEWNIPNIQAGTYFIHLNGEGITPQVKAFTVAQ